MPMKLYGSLTSPFVRKVRIVLAEKKIDYSLEIANPWDADSVVSSFNPLGKIPVLVLEDGTSIYDSSVIVDYLDTVTPISRLIPAASRQRIAVKRWEALADGLSDAAVTAFRENMRAPTETSPATIDRQVGKIDRALALLSADLGEQLWCTGNTFNLADIATGMALGYLDLRFSHVNWRGRHANLDRLASKLAKRPSFIDTAHQLPSA